MPEQFVFRDLRDLLAKANEEKSGDQLAGIAARSERERVAAKRKLADLSLGEIVRQPLIDPSDDEVSRLLLDTYDAERFQNIQEHDRGRIPGIDSRRCHDRGTIEAAAVGHHSGNRGGRRKNHEQQRPDSGGRKNQECNAMPEYHGRARRAGDSSAAESSCGRYWRNSAGRV